MSIWCWGLRQHRSASFAVNFLLLLLCIPLLLLGGWSFLVGVYQVVAGRAPLLRIGLPRANESVAAASDGWGPSGWRKNGIRSVLFGAMLMLAIYLLIRSGVVS